MTGRIVRNERMTIDGVDLGAVVTVQHPAAATRGPVTLEMTFKPNWPGIWHLQARSLPPL